MKRRGFLGFLGGAAVAGPAAAKHAVTAASKTGTGGIAKLGMGNGPQQASRSTSGIANSGDGNKTYLTQRVLDLKRKLSGELTDEEKTYKKLNDETALTVFEIETSGIRSMSEASKLRRMKRYAKQHSEWRERERNKINLSEALKELAGLK